MSPKSSTVRSSSGLNEATSDRGRRGQPLAALIALPLLLALFLTVGLLLGPRLSRAQGPTSLGIDLVSDGNSGALLDSVQDCVEVQVGDLFPLDVFVRDAHELRAFELRFDFDPGIIQIVDPGFNMFLLSTAPVGKIFPSLFEVDNISAGHPYFLAAAEFRGTPDSGSGVLARLTMEALAPGRSPVTIVTEPSFFSPRLTDADGNALFQGPVSGGEVSVGEPCSPSSSTPDPSPESGSTPTSEGEGGSSPSQPDDVAGLDAPPTLVALSDVPLRASDGEGASEDTEPSDADGPSGAGSTPEAAADQQPPEGFDDAGVPDEGGAVPAEDGGSSGISWPWLVILAVAVFGLIGGSALIALNLRSRL